MQIDPRVSLAFNVLLMVLSGLATGAVHFTGLVPDPVAAEIVGWAGIATFVLSSINTALHGYSAASSGPFVSLAAPSKIVLALILATLLCASGFVICPREAHATPLTLPHSKYRIVKHTKARVGLVTHRQKLSLNLNLLLTQLQAISLTDLQAAQADAVAQKDAVASSCYAAIITLVTNQQKALAEQTNLPDVHLVTSFQQMRDFALALRPGSAFSTGCAPLANEVKMDGLNFIAAVTAGSLSLSAFGL